MTWPFAVSYTHLNEMKELTASYQNDKYEFIKSPVIAEFLGFAQNTDFTEKMCIRDSYGITDEMTKNFLVYNFQKEKTQNGKKC